ncbi:MAG: nucleotidyltransferase domain-containing protein, partial [Candidatus Dormibacteraceae bacterium]
MTRDPAEGVSAGGMIVTGATADRVPAVYQPVVEDCTALLRGFFSDRLHGLYLYGSVATGQARLPESDLDLMAVWVSKVEMTELLTVVNELSARHAAVVREVGVASVPLAKVLADDRDGLG